VFGGLCTGQLWQDPYWTYIQVTNNFILFTSSASPQFMAWSWRWRPLGNSPNANTVDHTPANPYLPIPVPYTRPLKNPMNWCPCHSTIGYKSHTSVPERLMSDYHVCLWGWTGHMQQSTTPQAKPNHLTILCQGLFIQLGVGRWLTISCGGGLLYLKNWEPS